MDFQQMQLNDLKSDTRRLLLLFQHRYTELRLLYQSSDDVEPKWIMSYLLYRFRVMYRRLKKFVTIENIQNNPDRASTVLLRSHSRLAQLTYQASQTVQPMAHSERQEPIVNALNDYVDPISGVYYETYLGASFSGVTQTIYMALMHVDKSVQLHVGKHVSELTKQFYASLTMPVISWLNDKDAKQVKSVLSVKGPQALVVDSIGDGIHAGVFPMEKFFDAVKMAKRQDPFYLILDTTKVGPSVQPSLYLSRRKFPNWFHLILVRDLTVLDQEGMDLAPMASVTYLGKHKRQFLPMNETLSLLGQLLPVNRLGCLSIMGKKSVLQRLSRHYRNGVVLYRRISKFADIMPGIIDEVTFVGMDEQVNELQKNGLHITAGVVYFRLKPLVDKSDSETVDMIMQAWRDNAFDNGVMLHQGNGTAMHLTRIQSIPVQRGIPYVRVAPGYEDIGGFDIIVTQLLQILKQYYR